MAPKRQRQKRGLSQSSSQPSSSQPPPSVTNDSSEEIRSFETLNFRSDMEKQRWQTSFKVRKIRPERVIDLDVDNQSVAEDEADDEDDDDDDDDDDDEDDDPNKYIVSATPPSRKLLIFDLNGVLAYIPRLPADVVLRRGLFEFMQFCVDNFVVALWSSKMRHNVDRVLEKLPVFSEHFLFVYGYASIEKQRQRLPVYKYRTAILYLVEAHATTIVVGETGSGKTTQIPQFLKEAGWADGGRVIACTQPRRLAVQAVASRVAEEMGSNLEKKSVTLFGLKISLIRVIMVDEAHERSISTDILLGLLKKIQKRPELRLVISSATIEAKSMSNFFLSSKRRQALEGEELRPSLEPAILSVEGRGFNVQIHYVEDPVKDYVLAVVSTVLLIHDKEPPGDILVFLTGQDDIDAAIKLLTEEARGNGKTSSGLTILPLYSGLTRAEQLDALCNIDLVFSPTPKGKRKVVISTNIAETSLTLEGIVYVIDSGFSKQRFYNPITDIENLVVAPISKASAKQRAGRAGRIRPGKCYRLYTEEYYLNEMSVQGIPEIQRKKVSVCVAKYRRQRHMLVVGRNSRKDEDKLSKGANWRSRVGSQSFSRLRDERSYKDALVSSDGMRKGPVEEKIRVGHPGKDAGMRNLWEMHIPSDEWDWVKRSLTGIIKPHFDLELVLKGLASDGIKVKGAKWVGIPYYAGVFFYGETCLKVGEVSLYQRFDGEKRGHGGARALLRVASPLMYRRKFLSRKLNVAGEDMFRDDEVSEEEEDRFSDGVGRPDLPAEDTRDSVDRWLVGDNYRILGGGTRRPTEKVMDDSNRQDQDIALPEFNSNLLVGGINVSLQTKFTNEDMVDEREIREKEVGRAEGTEVERVEIPVLLAGTQGRSINKEFISYGLKRGFLKNKKLRIAPSWGDFNAYLDPEEKIGVAQNWHSVELFSNFVLNLNLMGLPLVGGRFTWCNNREAPTWIRLDQFLLSGAFFQVFPKVIQKVLPKSLSDHNPILLNEDLKNWGPKPFRFFNYLLEEDGFNGVVQNAVYDLKRENARRGMPSILQGTKKAIKMWPNGNNMGISKQISELENRINDLELKSQGRGISAQEWGQLLSWRNDLWSLHGKEESIWFQKSCLKWIKEGDRNTRFYHICALNRNRTNAISSLKVAGIDISNPSPIRSVIFDFFKVNYNEKTSLEVDECNLNFAKLTEEQKTGLQADFSEQEVWDAVFKSDSAKAPGPDGFTVGIEYWRKLGRKGVVFKVDFRRAYDSVEWPILFRIMKVMGFGEKWISWIKCCVSSASISVLVNGSPTEEFNISKGLRQRCSLSPLLFNLVGELLNLMLINAADIADRVKDWAMKASCGVGSFPMSYLGLPIGTRKNSKDLDKKRIHWVNWKSVSKPIEEGGLGILDLRQNSKMNLGNGWSIAFWSDVWITNLPLKNHFPRIFALSTNKWGMVSEFGEYEDDVWDESIAHLFLSCTVASDLWSKFLRLWNISSVLPQDPSAILCSLSNLRHNSLIWRFIPAVIFWSIWKARNLVVFENGKCDSNILFFITRFRLAKWFLAKYPGVRIQTDLLVRDPTRADKLLPSSNTKKVIGWTPPPSDMFKLNVDGAVTGDGMQGGIGGVLRDSFSCSLANFSSAVGLGLPIVTELKAIKNGLVFFFSSIWANRGRLILESDSKCAVKWILKLQPAPTFFSDLVEEIGVLVTAKGVVLRWVPRSCNMEADRVRMYCVYYLKALGIDNILGFDWPASPSPESMIRALEVLYSLGVLDDDAKLTSPVAHASLLYVLQEPMVAKMIISSNELGCSYEIITIAAVLSIQSIWFSSRGAKKELDEAKLRFAAAEGDHITFLNIYKGFLQSGKSSKWCHKNFINYHAMKKVMEVREQLKRIALRLGIVLKSCETDMQIPSAIALNSASALDKSQNWNSIDILRSFVQQANLIDLPLSGGEWNQLIECKKELWRLLRIEERIWFQKSRTRWIKDGDRNTSPTQFAFIPGRQLLDCACLANEGIDFWRKQGLRGVVFKVDFSRAYNTVDWQILLRLLNVMGFGERWCSWISQCISTASISVLVNGSPTEEFPIAKGLRQGCSLSPLLFNVVGELLHMMLSKAVEIGLFQGFAFGKNQNNFTLSHLQFADELIIFCGASITQIKNVRRVLRIYSLMAGLHLNLAKSKLFGINVEDDIMGDWAAAIGCSVGRLVLIKSVLSSLPVFFLSFFKIPSTICKKLNSLMAAFLWGDGAEKKKMHWVSWDKICNPSSCGGLGVADLKYSNRALLGKWVWKFANEKSSLWKRFICTKHDVSCDSMDITKVLSHKDSWIWRGIVNNFTKDDVVGGCLRAHAKLQVGNGKSISFWNDSWLGDVPLKMLFPRIFALSPIQGGKVADFGSFDSNGWEWNIRTRRNLCDWEVVQLVELLDRLKDIKLTESLEDCLLWDGVGEELFSVKAFPPRVEAFLWQVSHKKLPVRVELKKRGVPLGDDILCPLCNLCEESVQHLFISCQVLWELWNKIIGFWGISCVLPSDPPSLLSSWTYLKLYSAMWKFIPAAILWSLWKFRNDIIFNGGKLDSFALFFTVRLRLAKWFLAKYPKSSIQVDSLIVDPSLADTCSVIKDLNRPKVSWSPPPTDFYKMNVDGAVCTVGRSAGIGELKAIKKGIDLFVSSEWAPKGRLIVESDCKLAVEWLEDQATVPTFLTNLVKEIASTMSAHEIIVRWIPRCCNCEADKLAKEGIG
ncbi:RNA helicase family protein isoform 2 [Hibiscus syriacus]|uniref:RNA helicase n=1 Tax=Hibiscus syriacus TaxID=106335 RepID=A0A6A2XCA1_HIBSY|nr:RNA helicase family protein isoform 2 [Hibiscus syriacus]